MANKTITQVVNGSMSGGDEGFCEGHQQAYRKIAIGRMRLGSCPRCAEEAKAQQAAQMAAITRNNMLLGAGIPQLLSAASIHNYEPGNESQREALETCVDYLHNRLAEIYTNVIITGPVGVGKSHLAAALLRAHAERGLRVKWSRAAEVAEVMTCKWDPDGALATKKRQWLSCDLLVIDDLGMLVDAKEPRTVDAFETFLALRSHDGAAPKPTVMTTNVPIVDRKSLEPYIGDRGTDRMAAGAIFLSLNGKSYRERQAQDRIARHLSSLPNRCAPRRRAQRSLEERAAGCAARGRLACRGRRGQSDACSCRSVGQR